MVDEHWGQIPQECRVQRQVRRVLWLNKEVEVAVSEEAVPKIERAKGESVGISQPRLKEEGGS